MLIFYLCCMYWTALVHASCILWVNWWTRVWLLVTGPIVLGIDLDDPSSTGGILYSKSSYSDCILSLLWIGAICISKFWWTTLVLTSPCQSLMVYMGRFSCHSTTTYFMFSQWSPILCFPPNAFYQIRKRSLGSSLEALIFLIILSLLAGRLLMLMLIS